MSDMTHTITRLGHLGDGIAEGPIFAARTLPGEVVRGDVTGDRIETPKIVTPSSDRVKPTCSHYNTCGGCSLMHASDEFVANWKTEIVRNALVSHGIETEFRPIHTSPARSRRRAVLSARRGKKAPIVGFHGRRSGTITEISDCHLIHPRDLASPARAGRTDRDWRLAQGRAVDQRNGFGCGAGCLCDGRQATGPRA